jgi:hypothetical protein
MNRIDADKGRSSSLSGINSDMPPATTQLNVVEGSPLPGDIRKIPADWTSRAPTSFLSALFQAFAVWAA